MRSRAHRHSTLLCCARSAYVLYASLPRYRRNALRGLFPAAREVSLCAIAEGEFARRAKRGWPGAPLPHKSTRQRRYHFCGAPVLFAARSACALWARGLPPGGSDRFLHRAMEAYWAYRDGARRRKPRSHLAGGALYPDCIAYGILWKSCVNWKKGF